MIFRGLVPGVRTALLWASVAAATGCSSHADANDGDLLRARVEGERLILRPTDPQLASIASTSAMAAGADSLQMPGRMTWDEDATVRVFSPFAGRVLRVLVDAGHRVQRGESLALLTAPDVGQAQSDARRAATDLVLAERTAARVRDLVQHGVAAQKEIDGAEADVARARAEQQRTQARLSQFGLDSSAVNQVFALRAPLGGIVIERNVTPGQEVRPDQMLASAPQLFAPLFVVTDPSRLWVIVDVPERDLGRIGADSSIDIRTNVSSNRVFHGRITHVGGAMDPSTHSVKIRGVVSDPSGALKAEMLVTAMLRAASRSTVTIPVSAVLVEGGSHVVFVEEARGRLRRVTVEVGPAHDGVVPVLAGVAAGDHVITTGAILAESLFQSNVRRR